MSKTINLTESNDGQTVAAAVGDKIVVVLPLKSGTGFFWQDSGSTAGSLESIKHNGEDGMPGATVLVSFQFNIARAGSILLCYARPWAENTPPAKWFDIHITV